MSKKMPELVLGVPVVKVRDTWIVDDIWGSRTYCLVETKDHRQVTMLRIDGEWRPTLVTSA